MLQSKPILRFLLLFAGLYLVLAIVAGFCAPSAGSGLRTLGRWLLASPTGPRELTFEPAPAELRHRSSGDTRIVIANRNLIARGGPVPIRNVDLSLGPLVTSGIALLAALTLATPIPWTRRLRALVLGVFALVAAVLAIVSFAVWLESAEVYLVSFRPENLRMLRSIQTNFIPHLGLALPVLVWLLFALRRSDAIRFFVRGGAAGQTSDSPPGIAGASR